MSILQGKCLPETVFFFQVFFCKYNDPIYVKMEKLEIMIKLASDRNIDQVCEFVNSNKSYSCALLIRVHPTGECYYRFYWSSKSMLQK